MSRAKEAKQRAIQLMALAKLAEEEARIAEEEARVADKQARVAVEVHALLCK